MFKGEILDLIYPPKCGICGKISKDFLCAKCVILLEKQAIFEIEDTRNQKKNFDELLYVFKYEGTARQNILKYKFKESSYLYKMFVNFMLKNQKFFENIQKYDTIVPVPISKKRFLERGYNQSYLLAKEIAKKVGIKCENKILKKTKNIIEQSKLNKEDREKNIIGVYEIENIHKISDKKVLLLDDIITTGSTANECAKMLLTAKPKKIGVLTIAKD